MALKGTFDVLNFPELMGSLARSKATGRLLIRRRQGTLSIELRDGQLVVPPAADGSSDGKETVEQICLEAFESSAGTFEFKPESLNGSVSSTVPVDEVLTRAQARLDQYRQVEAVLDLRPRPVLAPDRENVTLSRDQWRLIMSSDGRRTVRSIARKLSTDEQLVCAGVTALLNEGVLELVDPVRDLVVKPPQAVASITSKPVEPSAEPDDVGTDVVAPALASVLSLLRTSKPPPPEVPAADEPEIPESRAIETAETEEVDAVDYQPIRAMVAAALGLIFLIVVVFDGFRFPPGPLLMFAFVVLGLVGTDLFVMKRGPLVATRSRPRMNWIAEFAIIVVLVLAVDFVLESLVVKRYRTSSGSMTPTIQVGQQLLVDRLAPQFQRPHRGDIIIFNPPAGAAINACGVDHPDDSACPLPTTGRLATVFVKRVVAVPGDQVAVIGGQAYVNGKRQALSAMPDDLSCDICDLRQAITIPPGYFFVMGDNRDHSNDSRVWGPVPNDWIIGRVFLSYWPLTRLRIF